MLRCHHNGLLRFSCLCRAAKLSYLATAAAILSLSISASGQVAAAEAVAALADTPTQLSGPGAVVLPSERLGADDLLELRVSYCPELSRDFRISSDGNLSLPLLHQKLMVAGLTPIEVAHSLGEALQQEKILVDPVISVSVLEYRSRPVSVVGAVNHPLTFQATGQTTLLDAIAKAGGMTANAGGSVIVSANPGATADAAQQNVQVIRVQDLIGGNLPRANLKLHGGEEIRIPEASKIFIVGNVKRPGMYPMQGDAETTVVKAIALSEGLDSYGASNAFIYRVRGTGGERDELKVPLNRILAHKSSDIALRADDILYFPASDGKRLTAKVLTGLAGFSQNTAAGLLIYK